MNRDEIFAVLRRHVLDALPHLDEGDVVPASDLHDLGANSLDRIDILTATLDALQLDDDASEFAGITELDSLADAFHKAGEGT